MEITINGNGIAYCASDTGVLTMSNFDKKSIIKLVIRDGVTSIEPDVFRGCSNLREVVFPTTLKSIQVSAFEDTGIISLHLPASLEIIGDSVFANCKYLQEIIVDELNPVFFSEGNCCLRRDNLSVVIGCKTSIIPANCVSIGRAAFCGVDAEEIIIPKNVSDIAYGAFHNSSLKRCTIPDNVRVIRGSVFSACKNLCYVRFSKNVERIDFCAFASCHSLETITIDNPYILIDRDAFAFSPTRLLYSGIDIPETANSKDEITKYLKNKCAATAFSPMKEKLGISNEDNEIIRICLSGTPIMYNGRQKYGKYSYPLFYNPSWIYYNLKTGKTTRRTFYLAYEFINGLAAVKFTKDDEGFSFIDEQLSVQTLFRGGAKDEYWRIMNQANQKSIKRRVDREEMWADYQNQLHEELVQDGLRDAFGLSSEDKVPNDWND